MLVSQPSHDSLRESLDNRFPGLRFQKHVEDPGERRPGPLRKLNPVPFFKLLYFKEHDENWASIDLLIRDRSASFQEIADDAFDDLLRKYRRIPNFKRPSKRASCTPGRK